MDADSPKRALLIGPEGSGKTMFATCLAGVSCLYQDLSQFIT